MSRGSMHGGGFFFQPFSRTQTYYSFSVQPDVAPAWGLWQEIIPSSFTSRWMRLEFQPNGALLATGVHQIQLGLGAAGLETLWQPQTGAGVPPVASGFLAYWSLAAADVPVIVPAIWNFPISLNAGARVSVRAQTSPGPTPNLITIITVWG